MLLLVAFRLRLILRTLSSIVCTALARRRSSGSPSDKSHRSGSQSIPKKIYFSSNSSGSNGSSSISGSSSGSSGGGGGG